MSGVLSINAARRKTIRAPYNPNDKATVISIFPKLVDERKPTIEPGRFIIKPGSESKPTFLVVGPSSWWREIDEEQPLLEIPCYSTQIAESIVRDFCNGLFGCNMSTSMPGLFWVPVAVKSLDSLLASEYAPLYAKAIEKQKNYFNALIKLTDTLWARTNGSPLCVSEDARIAAKELNLAEGKPWMRDFNIVTNMSKCVACGSLRDSAYPVCPTCKAVSDVELAKSLGIKFADR